MRQMSFVPVCNETLAAFAGQKEGRGDNAKITAMRRAIRHMIDCLRD